MSNIRVDLTAPIYDGKEVVFRSPADCSQVTGLILYYGDTSQEFMFADAHGNNVGDIDHLFAENVVVKVILDLKTGMAFVQNADTNVYLEGRFAECLTHTEQSLTEEQKAQARANIGAAKEAESVNVLVGEETVATPTIVVVEEDTLLYKIEDNGVEIFGIGNLFNKDAWIPNKRYDDSGNIVNDGSSGYVDTLFPVDISMHLSSTITLQRLYLFDKNREFIGRTAYGFSGNTKQKLSNFITNETKYIKVQCGISDVEQKLNTAQIRLTLPSESTDISQTPYTPFFLSESTDGTLFVGRNFVRSETSSTATIKTYGVVNDSVYAGRTSALFNTIDVWEPESVDDGYSNPTTEWGTPPSRENWMAEDKYTYYDFLDHYYDIYLGKSKDGYCVTKKSLGQDCANSGHEIFEYDFCPVNYKYTVLLSAGMNADETQGIWGLATFIRCVMNREEPNVSIARDNIRFKVIPIINASGFDSTPLSYRYADGVNPNYNFNHKDSWSRHTGTGKGEYPDSNIATVILKKWLNDNSGRADLWIDLHTGRWKVDTDTSKTIIDVRVADSSMSAAFAPYKALIKQFYIEKGFITADDDIGYVQVVRDNLDYQKGVYAFDVCGIPSIMPEMHLESTGYGTDGYTNNAPNGIKAYVLQIRAMVMAYINVACGNALALDSEKDARFHNRYL